MSRLRRYGMTVVTMASVATVVLLVTGWGSAVASNIGSVFVANTSSNPVPVQAVGTVPTHEQGTAKVQVQNLDADGNVKVREQGVVTVRDPAAPTQRPAVFFFEGGDSAMVITPDVPAGQVFIVQTISVTSAGSTGDSTDGYCRLFAAGAIGALPVSINRGFLVVLQQVFIPIAAGQRASLQCSTTPTIGLGFAGLTSGYFVPAS